MKFEHVLNILDIFFFKLNLFSKLSSSIFNRAFVNFFSSWKVSNYADGYWFLFSNKKFLYELRFVL